MKYLIISWWWHLAPSPLIKAFIQSRQFAIDELGDRGCHLGEPEMFLHQARLEYRAMKASEQRFVSARYPIPRDGFTWSLRP